jgi:hypothetical protein
MAQDIQRYALLEDQPGFSVVVYKTRSRFKLVYRDTRDPDSSNHQVFTKYWETQGAANTYIALYKKLKENQHDNRNHQGQLV